LIDIGDLVYRMVKILSRNCYWY